MMVSVAFNYNVTVPFIDSDAMLCVIQFLLKVGPRGGGGGGGAKIRIPVPKFSNGYLIFTDLKKQNKTNNVELSSAESLCPITFTF